MHRGPTVYQGIKPTLLLDIRNLIEKGRIKFYAESAITRIEDTCVQVQTGDTQHKIPNDFVFSLIGYRPDAALLRDAGVIFDPATEIPHFDPETYETNVPNLFVAGVVTGGITNKVFIDDGHLHGLEIAKKIADRLVTARA